ncbi:MAG: hypothetical protein KGM98_13235, partial [Bacteroidota bacterium]|nr:hypothetical protein [Bacteroidota bacterium]
RMKQEGRLRFCEPDLKKLNEVADWVEQYREFWTQKLDALETYLETLQKKGPQPVPKPGSGPAKKRK